MTTPESADEPKIKYSDFIIYVDESGDHSLTAINPRYPLFMLSFCIFRKTTYNDIVAPAIRRLKFDNFGHDMVILHEADIRKKAGGFSHLGKTMRESFLNALTNIIAGAPFELVAIVIDKLSLNASMEQPSHAYHLALAHGLKNLYHHLKEQKQDNTLTHVICEARGAKEDAELELEFRRICDLAGYAEKGITFAIVIADKKTNSEGLQLADLTARPIGLSVLRPEQTNRAYAVLKEKFYALNIIPQKSRRASE